MAGFYSIINKELTAVMREKTIVFAIVIQLLIAAFSSVILVGLMSYYDPDSIAANTNLHFKVGLVGDTGGPLQSYLAKAGCNVTRFSTAEAATAMMQEGKVDVVIVVPEAVDGVVNMRMYLPRSDTQDTVITVVLKQPLKSYENYLREQNGVHVQYTDIKGKQSTTFEFLYSFIIPMLMLFPAFIAGSMIIDSISEEVENKTLDTLLTAPVSLNAILFGKVAAAVFLAAMQCILWIFLLSVNRLYVQNSLLVVALAIIVAAFVTLGSGIISMYFKDRERSQFAYSVLLMGVAAVCLIMNPSPINLMARLGMGDVHVGVLDVALCLVPLVVLAAAFLLASRRLLALKA
jgi:ABC-2 type transport system permease protein